MTRWVYKDTHNFIVPENAVGFVYMIVFEEDLKYIGKKSITGKQTLPAKKDGTIRENAERIAKLVFRDVHNKIIVSRKDKLQARKEGLKAKREYYDVLNVESSWRTYMSSSEETANHTPVSKHILQWAYSKKELTYLENKYLYSYEVLEDPAYLNKNIEGRFFAGELKNKGK